jgi:hypothetical protein
MWQLLAITMMHASAAPLADIPYEEIFPTRLPYVGMGASAFPQSSIIQAFACPGGVIVKTSKAEFWRSDSTGTAWIQLSDAILTSEALLLEEAKGTSLVVAHNGGISIGTCKSTSSSHCQWKLVATIENEHCFNSLTGGKFNASSGEIALSCGDGLFLGTADATAPKALTRESAVDGGAIWVAAWAGRIAVATKDRVYLREPSGSWWWEWSSYGEHRNCSHSDHDYAGGAVEFVATVGAFDPGYGAAGGLWLGSEYGLQVWCLGTGELQRIGRTEGLPSPNITVLRPAVDGDAPCGQLGPTADCCCLWTGTAHGAARLTSTAGGSSSWRYIRGRRWLPTDEITAMATLGEGRMLVATTGGISILEGRPYTLAQKAKHYQAKAYPRHSRYGYSSDCGLAEPGNLSSYFYKDSDNDGLWTSMYTAAQAFRYAVETDPKAKAAARVEALTRFNALLFLYEASGGVANGFPARSAARVGDKIYSGGTWHNSTLKPGWKWKGDTSSDEITGHMFAYPTIVNLLNLNASEKKRVVDVTSALVGGIVAHNLTLIDPSTGNRTRWGSWSPEMANTARDWSDNRGLRALELLSYLAAAEQITGGASKIFNATSERLRRDNAYGRMMINCKISDPCDDNHSDDEEAFLPLYTYITAFHRLGRPLDSHFKATLDRLCRITQPESSSLYLAICAVGKGKSEVSPALADNLRGWPVDLVDWGTKNSDRLDLWPQQAPFEQQSTSALPSRDAARMRWNANPYDLDSRGSGTQEYDPGAFLLAYWMARHHGLLAAPKHN